MSHHNSNHTKDTKEKKFTDKFHKPSKSEVKNSEPENLEVLENPELSALKEENENLNKKLLLLAADYDNYRKRVSKDLEEASNYSINKFAKELIDVLENLYRAETSINTHELESNALLKQIFAGVELTKKSLIDIFNRHGIIRINPMGESFNHDLHQAITEIPSDEHKVGTIVQVIQAGYTLHGRLIRPALVVVSKG